MMYSVGLKVEPSPDARLTVFYDYIDDKTSSRPVTSLTSPGELFCTPGIDGCGRPMSDTDYHRHPTSSFLQPAWYKAHSVIANGEWEFAPDHGLYAVLGYRESKEDAIHNFAGVRDPLFYARRPQTQDQFSVELRYQGEVERLKMVAGAFYFNSNYNNGQQTWMFGQNLPADASRGQVWDAIKSGTLPGEVPGFDATQHSRNFAFFGQFDWEVVDNLTLSVGGRYTKERKRMCAGNATGNPGERVYVSAFGDCPDNLRDPAFYEADAYNPVTGDIYPQTGKASWSRFTPRIGIDYKFDQGMVYASYSEGFRSGGFNGRPNNAFNLGPYGQEKVTNYEIGFKTQFADNRVRFNVSAFQADYKDKQEDVIFPDPVAVTVTLVQNAAKVRIRGFEAEFQTVPVDNLTLGLNIGHIDGKYKKWLDIGNNLDPLTAGTTPFVPIDKSDFKLRRAPKWSFDASVNYRHELGNSDALLFDLAYRWKDDYYIVANTRSYANPNPGHIKSFGILDGSVSYDAEHWKLSVWGKNLTGTNYFQHTLDVGTPYGAYPGDPTPIALPGLWTYGTIGAPRTFGVDVQIKF